MRDADAVDAETLAATEPPSGSEGFVLEEIEMRRFMRYIERTDPPLRFPEKFTVITGRTGAGKSSILDAITYALYNDTARTDIRSVKTSDVCHPGGYVRLVFRQGDGRWEVKRGFTSRRESYLEISRDGESLGGTIPEKERTLRDVVGLDYEGFRNSTFVRQEEMKELGAQQGAARLAVFQTLFRLEVFEKALERAKEQKDGLDRELQARDAGIAARAEALQRLPGLQEELEAAARVLEEARGRVASGEDRVREAEASLRRLHADHEVFVRADAGRAEAKARIDHLSKRIEDVRSRSREAADLEAERRALEAETAGLDALREELDRLRERSEARKRLDLAADAALKLFEQAKKEHERRRDGIKDKIDALHRKVAGLKTDLDRESAFDLLRDEGRLEERVSRIAKETGWLADRPDVVRELEQERLRASKALERVREKVATIGEDAFVLTEFRRQMEALKEELREESEAGHRTLKPLDDDKVEALRARDAAPWSPEDGRRLEDLARRVPETLAKRRRADELAARLQGLRESEALVADLERQRADLEREVAAREREVEGLRAAEAAFEQGRDALEALRKQLEAERRVFHQAEGQATQLRRTIADLEKDAGRLEESRRQRRELALRQEILQLLVDRVFHKRGVVMYAVDQLLPELEIEASKNLAELTDGRFSRIKLETYEEGRGHGIRILVQGVDGAWHDVGEFSGGEKTQINAALRFAIARELASLPQVGRTYGRMKTLFIDEGDLGSLDTEVSRELFVRKLFRMGEFFEKVILITHLAEVADKFPGRIRVTMTPNQESRVEVLG